MSKEETLKTYLSTLTSKSVFADEKPKNNDDCVVYRRISTYRVRNLSGTTNLERVRFQIDVYGPTKADVRTVVELIKSNLDGNHVEFKTATLDSEFDYKEIELGIHHAICDFFVW